MRRQPVAVDVFCGAGGMTLGLMQAGFDVACGIDSDPLAIATYRTNFPKSCGFLIDVRKFRGEFIRWVLWSAGVLDGKIDLMAGGPPCQGFSCMGRRDPRDRRNRLVLEYARAVVEVRPKAFVMENVPGLMLPQNRAILDNAIEIFSKRYTVLEPTELTASDFGVPTTRSRIFLVGYDKGETNRIEQKKLFSAPHTTATVADAFEDLPADLQNRPEAYTNEWAPYFSERPASAYARRLREWTVWRGISGLRKPIHNIHQELVSGCLMTRHESSTVRRFDALPQGGVDAVSRYPRLSLDGLCGTLRAGTGPDRGSYMAARPIHPFEPRVITVREAARLQGFPDSFYFNHSKWHSFRHIGNSVCPPVVAHIAGVVRAAV